MQCVIPGSISVIVQVVATVIVDTTTVIKVVPSGSVLTLVRREGEGSRSSGGASCAVATAGIDIVSISLARLADLVVSGLVVCAGSAVVVHLNVDVGVAPFFFDFPSPKCPLNTPRMMTRQRTGVTSTGTMIKAPPAFLKARRLTRDVGWATVWGCA
ncbi:hypothetical protein VTN02DRAFT_56 [Thermoascus thermophilus]